MKISIEKETLSAVVREKESTEGGRNVPEAHVPEVTWIPVKFLTSMRIAWN